jgi:MscS family membrane protein
MSIASVCVFTALLVADAPTGPELPCGSPRRAAATILGNLARAPESPDQPPTDDAIRRALRCIETPRGMASATVIERLRTLQETLDAVGVVVKPADIPDDPSYIDARTFRATFVLSPQAPRIRLQKNDHGEWRLPSDTLEHAETIHDELVGIDLQRFTRNLRPVWRRAFFGIQAWQGVGLLAVLGVGLLLRFMLGAIVTRRLVQLAHSVGWDATIDDLRASSRPLGWLIACATVWLLVPTLALPARWSSRLLAFDRVVAAFCFVWLLMRVVDLVASHLATHAKESPSRMDDHLVLLTRRILKLLLALLGGVMALQSFGVDVGSLVAGLGIGGLAVALAAKDTIGNFFGSIAIFLDRPFQMGDSIATTNGSVEGTVESVGLRSTQVRTIGDTVVTVPNAKMADAEINNFGARRRRRIRLSLSFARDAEPSQLRSFTATLREHLLRQPFVDGDDAEVVAHDLTETAVVVLVHFYVKAATWSEELRQRHDIILAIVEIADEVGLRLVLPPARGLLSESQGPSTMAPRPAPATSSTTALPSPASGGSGAAESA